MDPKHQLRIVAFCCCLALALLAGDAQARGGVDKNGLPKPLANFSLSKEFYLTFPQNLHEGSGPLDLTCFIASNYPAKGTIELLGDPRDGVGKIVWKQNFKVDSTGIAQVMIPHQYNNYAEIQDIENELPKHKAVHITSDQPIVVYGLNHWPFTSDGYLAIPPGAWGKAYTVASYYGITRTDEYPTLRATSQFAIVAAFDNTGVTIQLSDDTMDGQGRLTHKKGSAVPVVLNKGDVYQMQARKVAGQLNDLSGTVITSSKPIGVLGGAKCTDIPKTKPACDHIIEMLPPQQTWGTDYFSFPFEPSRRGGDTWRIYPLQDGTDVFLNGSNIASISPSDPATPFLEVDNLSKPELRSASYWHFTKPVMMCQYINGETYDGSDHGDPSFVVLESKDEFQTGVVFATPPDSNSFTNYINVMIDGQGKGLQDSLYLDGRKITNLPSGTYNLENKVPIPGTSYYAIHVKIPGGAHKLRSQSGFSAYAVGFKSYESYAWACALALRKVVPDTLPPLLPGIPDCGELFSSITDKPDDSVRSNLAQIGWMMDPKPDTTYNYDSLWEATAGSFIPGDSTVDIHVRVLDLRNNAHGALYATDYAGNDTTYYFDYTADSVTVNPSPLAFGKVSAGQTRTQPVTLKNPLSKSVTIDSLWLVTNTVFKITQVTPPLPITLAANATATITVKYTPVVDGFDEDTIYVKFPCFSRPLVVVRGGSGTPCVSVTDLDFGVLTLNVSTGDATKDSIVTIKNVGTDTLTITNLRIGGTPTVFTIKTASPYPIVLVPDSSITVTITFTPTRAQPYRDSIILTSNGKAACSHPVGQLIGAAIAPGPTVTPQTWRSRVSCPDAKLNGLVFTNTGAAADELDSIALVSGNTADFSITATLPMAIPAGGAPVNVRVIFTAADTGLRSATVRLWFKSGVILDTVLLGTGLMPQLTSPDVDWGTRTANVNYDTVTAAVSVPKTYLDPLGVTSFQIVGANGTAFSVIDNSVVPTTLNAANDTVQIRLRFRPSFVGLHVAQLIIHHNATFSACRADTIFTVNLRGTGASLGLTVDDWDAGRVYLTTSHDTVLYVHNNGAVAATVDSLWMSDGTYFSIIATPLPFAVAAGGKSPVHLRFIPRDTILYVDTLNVRSISTTPLVQGVDKGVGKVVIYTASVPKTIQAAYASLVSVPIEVNQFGYERPSIMVPGDPTPLDSGAIGALHLGLRFDPTVLMPIARNSASAIDIAGTLTTGWAISNVRTTMDSIVFDVAGTPDLIARGQLAWVKFRTLYSTNRVSQIIDTISSTVPWVIWTMIPGQMTLDSVCGLRPGSVVYRGSVAMGSNAPNPVLAANPSATLPLTLDRTMYVRLSVINALGAELMRPVDGMLGKGSHVVSVDTRMLPPGVYALRLEADGVSVSRTMVVLK
jgi:hypothetical protein